LPANPATGAEASRRDLARLLCANPIDLARAALAIAREEYPDLEDGPTLRALEELAQRARATLVPGASVERKVGRLSAFLFHEEGFAGAREAYADPRSSFLNDVVERRTGIPITLSLVYLEVGRRLGLEVQPVGFPGHFLCKVPLPGAAGGLPEGGELVIDCFSRGQLLGRAELEQRFKAAVGPGHAFDARALRPATPKEIVARMLENLRQLYEQQGDLPRALSAVDRALLVVPDSVRALRERASLYERLGGAQAAAQDLARVLELEPQATDSELLREKAERLREAPRLLN
jgi:regulator of sirC expression with transglutaminase-like and TPR domain